MHGRVTVIRSWPMWLIIGATLAFLYMPLVPALLISIRGEGAEEFTFRWFLELWRIPLVIKALRTTAVVALLVGVITPVLGLLAALSIRELGLPRLILLIMLLPLFIPGVSMGLASAFLFRLLEVPPSLFTMVIVQVIWALPFATLIILTVMSTFDPVYLEAAYMAGASRWRAFRDIELPLIAPGIFGAASFSIIISLNETVRTSVVQGPWNTIPTYIWSTYKQVGLSPALYALMTLVILSTAALAGIYLLLNRSKRSDNVIAVTQASEQSH
jgi:spermidine/putrescine transport system permease protein